MTAENFSALLRAALLARQINQTELGKLVGRSRVTIARWVNGKQLPDELTRRGVASLLAK